MGIGSMTFQQFGYLELMAFGFVTCDILIFLVIREMQKALVVKTLLNQLAYIAWI